MEIIKQKQYLPLPVEHQVMIFFAAVEKYLDDLDIGDIEAFETGLYEHMDSLHPEVSQSISETGDLSDEMADVLRKGIEKYKEGFLKNEEAAS
jgi:F-type H+-transporting ATPase subunit alpha